MLRQELERLQAALDRDRARKGKKGKKASKKKGRRGGKKGKKKKERDLTPDRTLESLFEELVANGIIRKYPETPLSAFKGERSFGNFALRQQGKDPLPSLGDVRQVRGWRQVLFHWKSRNMTLWIPGQFLMERSNMSRLKESNVMFL